MHIIDYSLSQMPLLVQVICIRLSTLALSESHQWRLQGIGRLNRERNAWEYNGGVGKVAGAVVGNEDCRELEKLIGRTKLIAWFRRTGIHSIGDGSSMWTSCLRMYQSLPVMINEALLPVVMEEEEAP